LILILSDINMPGMTGLELLPKGKAARRDVPVIMITVQAASLRSAGIRNPQQFQTFNGLRVDTAQTMLFDEVAERQTKADKTGDSSPRPAAPATTFPPTRI
jgi:CheY-like chemotaxis protein